MFNYTIVAEKDNDGFPIKYTIKEKDNTGIKVKFIQSDLLTMFLVPGSSKMDFGEVFSMNNEAIKRLRRQTEAISTLTKKNQAKIQLIESFNDIMSKWIEINKPLEKAKELFVQLATADFPDGGLPLRLV